MSQPIIFIDFDGTICHSKFWRSLDDDLAQKVQKLVFKDNRVKVNDWMRGKCTAEEINQLVADELAINYDELWEVFVKDCQTMEVDTEVLEKIQSLRDRYKTVLITDNMDNFSRFTVPALHLENYFDTIVSSSEVGKMKKDDQGQLFVDYAVALGSSIQECYLLDDSMDTCSLFQELGGKAYQITPDRDTMYYLESSF
jgi:FMN phosphatase YigB (HAD superfamily)